MTPGSSGAARQLSRLSTRLPGRGSMKLPARFCLSASACLILAGQVLMAHDPHDPIAAVAVSPNYAQDQTVLAATGLLSLKYGIYPLLKSTDGGVIWSVVQNMPNNSAILQVLFSPAYAQDKTIYVLGAGGLFRSTNQGASWTQYSKLSLINASISPNFAVDNTLFAVTTQHSVIKSTNRGQMFTAIAPPASLTGNLSAIAVSPNFAVDNTLLLGTAKNGIFESTNGGTTWVSVTPGLTSQVTGLAFSPNFSTDHTAFATTYGAGVLVSLTGGTSWGFSNTGITDLNVSSLALSPTYLQDSTVWITSATAGVYQSNSRGASWTLGTTVPRTLSGLTSTHYQAVAPASGGSSALLYLAMFEGLWTSSNSAQSWLYIDTLPTRLVRHINLSPNFTSDHTVFASTYGGGNLWSSDGGSTWTLPNTGMQLSYTDASGISPNFAVDATAFSSCANGLQITTNAGATWQLEQGGLTPAPYPRALAVSPNFAQDSTILIGLSTTAGSGNNNGLFLSQDAGNTWLATSLTNVTGVISIAFSPAFATDRTAFVASPSNGVYKSIDGGMTWLPLTLPLTSSAMALVAVTPSFATDQTVFAAAVSGGILKSTDGGTTWVELAGTSVLRAMDIQISPNYANDQSFFVGTLQKGLLKFTNGGTKILAVAYPDTMVTAVALSPNLANDHTLFAASYHGLYKSTTSGSGWTYVGAPARMEESRQANSSYAPQNPPSIVYNGTWSGITPSSQSSANAFVMTNETNDTTVLYFTGTGVRWVGWTGPTQGMASVSLDGVPQTTVSLHSTIDLNQQTLWSLQGFACGLHTLTVTALVPSVSVDAFDVWINSCPTS